MANSTISSHQKSLDVVIKGNSKIEFNYDTMLTFKSKEGMPLMTYAYGHYKGETCHMEVGDFCIHKTIALPPVLSKGVLKVDLYLHHPMVEVFLKVADCCILECEGYQDGYGRALNQDNEGIIGLLNF